MGHNKKKSKKKAPGSAKTKSPPQLGETALPSQDDGDAPTLAAVSADTSCAAKVANEPDSEIPMSAPQELDGVGLQGRLERRPSVAELQKRHVLEGHELGAEAPIVSNGKAKLEYKLVADRLKEHLLTQPDETTLRSCGIMPGGAGKVAPALQAAQRMLSLNLKRSRVDSMLSHRPSRRQLQEAGVHLGGTVADSVVGAAHALEREMSRNALKHLLEQRPDVSELGKQGICHVNVAPVLQAISVHLDRRLTGAVLSKKLRRRPSLHDMNDCGWFAGGAGGYRGQSTEDDRGGYDRTCHGGRGSGSIIVGGSSDGIIGRVGCGGSSAVLEDAGADADVEVEAEAEAPVDARTRYAIALKAAAHLAALEAISVEECGALKDLILDDEKCIADAVSAFEASGDVVEMLDKFHEIVLQGIGRSQGLGSGR